MSKIRINDLARELEVKSKPILDVLPEIGVTEKKTHSSSLEEHEAEKLRAHLRGGSEASVTSKPARPSRDGDEIKTKIDLSHISKPGDVLRQSSANSNLRQLLLDAPLLRRLRLRQNLQLRSHQQQKLQHHRPQRQLRRNW